MPRQVSSNQVPKVGSGAKSGKVIASEGIDLPRLWLERALSEETPPSGYTPDVLELQVNLLKAITARLVGHTSAEELVQAAFLLGQAIPGIDKCFLLLFNPMEQLLLPEAAADFSPAFVSALAQAERRTRLLTAAAEKAKPSLVIDLPGTPRFGPVWRLVRGEGIESLWLISVRDRDGGLLGSIVFASCQAFSPTDHALALARILADWMAVALEGMRARQDRERFKDAFDHATDAMMIIDHDHRIVAFNLASEKLTGWRREHAVGRHCWEIYLCGDGSTPGQSGYLCVLTGEKEYSGSCLQHTFTNVEGKKFSVAMHRASLPPSLYYQEGHQIVIVRDISTQRHNGRVNLDVIAAVSHELLSPLTLIKGYTATLLQLGETITEEQRSQYFRGIESATGRLTWLAENLLNVSRLEAGHLDLVVEPISLSELLRKSVSEMQGRTTQHVIKLRLPRSLPLVHADRKKIEQVMINVLVNAAKYSPQGGDIEVSVRHVQDEDELVAILGEVSSVKLPCLIVAVRDSGVGILEDELGRVFEKFYRVDNRLTRATSGAGLGLHICKLIVEAHGGHIWAKSKVGEGSTFSFSLPTEKPTRRRRE